MAVTWKQLAYVEQITADIATHAAIANAHHNAVTAGADAEHTMATQVILGVDASTTQKGHASFNPLDFTSVAGVVSRIAKFKVGSFQRDVSLASGNQVITGVGFTPKAIIFIGTGAVGTTDKVNWCIATPVNYSLIQLTTDIGYRIGTNVAINFYHYGGAGNNTYALIASWDADGFTLTWTKNGSPTGTADILYLALG